MYIASLGPISGNQIFDEEGTGWGWRPISKIETQNTLLPTSCKMTRPG
jgi:branched-chain amino acid transport system substrate-binding protein